MCTSTLARYRPLGLEWCRSICSRWCGLARQSSSPCSDCFRLGVTTCSSSLAFGLLPCLSRINVSWRVQDSSSPRSVIRRPKRYFSGFRLPTNGHLTSSSWSIKWTNRMRLFSATALVKPHYKSQLNPSQYVNTIIFICSTISPWKRSPLCWCSGVCSNSSCTMDSIWLFNLFSNPNFSLLSSYL